MDIPAEAFVELSDETELEEITSEFKGRKRVLGGGSNVLLTKPVSGLVILNKLSGISILKEDDQHVWLKVYGGENWHRFVMLAVQQNLSGIENLALIPGSVGASPIQNIGAYGVEIKEVIESVTIWHWEDASFRTLSTEDCAFGYRDSIFKRSLKDSGVVTSVVFKLGKQPTLRTSYGAILEELDAMNQEPSTQSIAEAVIRIRQSKLPDPAVLGNAGSFFKNPTISREQFNSLHRSFPNMPSYNVGEDAVKIPAGWLIEQCGLKGRRFGTSGVHERQALVLVNYGGATGAEVMDVSREVINRVKERYGIVLEREVQIW